MTEESRKDRDAAASEDPERLLVATAMAEAPKSSAELAEATGLPLARVRRHVRAMREEGLIESVARKSKRGTVEHFNLLLWGIDNDEEEFEKLTLAERRRVNGSILRIVMIEATRALVTHPTDRGLERPDAVVVRVPVFTDEEGWKELAKLHQEFYERILAVREQIAKRVEENGGEGFKASSNILLFDAETTD